MKSLISSLIVLTALAGCAADRGGIAASSPAAGATGLSTPIAAPGVYTTDAIAEDSYEITYSGPWTGSRDAIEGDLLYRTALLAREHGSSWFRFLHMPGEAGPLSHPARPSSTFGLAYGHWQPHWNYLTGLGWQKWQPEWGVPFWGTTADGRGVQQVEVHAMIELGRGSSIGDEPTVFDVAAILRDLKPFRG